VDAYAEAIAEDFPDLDEDQRHVQAVLMLLTPGADGDPTQLTDHAPVVNLYVHLDPGPDSTGIARLEGHGPVTEDWSARPSDRSAGSRSSPSSTSPAWRRSTPRRSPIDIDRQCI
jgi:hypothetical protein